MLVATLASCASKDLLDGLADSAPVEADAGVPDAAPPCAEGEVYWELTVREENPPSYDPNGALIAGVRTCVLDAPETCAETDANGVWAGCVPASADVAFTFEKPGFTSTLYPTRSPDDAPDMLRHTNVALVDDTQGAMVWGQLGVEYPPTGALVVISFRQYDPQDSWLPDCLARGSALFDPVPAVGPAYFDPAGIYDPDATSVASMWCFAAAAFDTSQEVSAWLSHETLSSCGVIDGGWVGAAPNILRVPTRAGFRTIFHVVCR